MTVIPARKSDYHLHLQEQQEKGLYWSQHWGKFTVPEPKLSSTTWHGQTIPSGLALHHLPMVEVLKYVISDYPATEIGKNWTREQIIAAVEQSLHVSVLAPDANEQHKLEVKDKVGTSTLIL